MTLGSSAEWRAQGVVLAAGRSARVGFPKGLATLAGETLLSRVGATLRAGGCGDVLFVLAPPHGARLAASLPTNARWVTNPHPERGMLSSLLVALKWLLAPTGNAPEARPDADSRGATRSDTALLVQGHAEALAGVQTAGLDALVVALVDHPRVSPATVLALLAAAQETGAGVVRPRFGERRGHPFVLARSEFERALALGQGDPHAPAATLRDVVQGAATSLVIEVEDPFILDDLDDPEALRRAGALPPKATGGR